MELGGTGHQHSFPASPQGRFTIAAKHHISIAEIYETELVDIEKVRGGGGARPTAEGAAADRPWHPGASPWVLSLGSPLVSERGDSGWGPGSAGAKGSAWVPGGVGRGAQGRGASSSPLPPVSPQAIAHYEQSADYYKGEESNRYPGAPLLLPPSPPSAPASGPPSSPLSPPQLGQQVSAEGGRLRRAAGAVPEGH